MENFKGTPGPWSVNHHYNWIESENADKVVIGGSQGFGDNDANLIAAAPELLEALKLIISYHDDGNCVLHKEDVSMAKAAIKKALGEKQ